MNSKMNIISIILVAFLAPVNGQEKAGKVVINADLGEETISRHIYGHFSEHLGRCIYGGYWVGEDSDIANTRGIRNDVVEALKVTGIPNLRWPGGCFAGEYHWRDGIGPREARPTMVNPFWGGVIEDNSFGTHEFLDLCEQLEAEPVICGNVGSGSVEEMSNWVEYINFAGTGQLADLRRVNGRDEPWDVKYWGIGNENWGCGGHMTAEFYADQYRRYATYCRSYDKRLMKIAGGAVADDYHWTETLMKNIPHSMMYGLSLHQYTTNEGNESPATGFGEDLYMDVIHRCLEIEEVIDRHMTIMDRYDPDKSVALVVDEWGAWHKVEEGTNPGFLYQQNTLRDAMVAALSLNYFNERCERIKMANLSQTVNVLQAMILTEEAKMLKTPTYHVFDMYQVHHDATLIPVTLESPDYAYEETSVPMLSVSASRSEADVLNVSIVNVDPHHDSRLSMDLRGIEPGEISGRILTAGEMDSHNTFDAPDQVKPNIFEADSPRKGKLDLNIPAKSIVVLEIQPDL